MPRKCQPGTICIENITLIFLIMIIVLIIYLVNKIQNKTPDTRQDIRQDIRQNIRQDIRHDRQYRQDAPMFLNPHTIPSRSNIYDKSLDPRGLPVMPTNVRTQMVEQQFRQVGILTRQTGETILPLMGRTLLTNRSKYQFYTMNDKNNMIKLPISKNGKSCTGEYGCDDLMSGDTVYVEGYKDTFNVTMYESSITRFVPF
jgi:hypothetical protein